MEYPGRPPAGTSRSREPCGRASNTASQDRTRRRGRLDSPDLRTRDPLGRIIRAWWRAGWSTRFRPCVRGAGAPNAASRCVLELTQLVSVSLLAFTRAYGLPRPSVTSRVTSSSRGALSIGFQFHPHRAFPVSATATSCHDGQTGSIEALAARAGFSRPNKEKTQ